MKCFIGIDLGFTTTKALASALADGAALWGVFRHETPYGRPPLALASRRPIPYRQPCPRWPQWRWPQ